MKLSQAVCCALILLPLLLLAPTWAQTPDDCPDEVASCAVDPCSSNETTCLRFINAECVVNRCFGLCSANFVWRGNNVTNTCDVNTCDDRVCPPTRQCVESVFPSMCLPGEPACRQWLRTRCMLRPFEHTMSCTEISCEPGLACRMRQRPEGFPPVVRCFPEERVKACVPGTCNDGQLCIDNGPSVTCMPMSECDQFNAEICGALRGFCILVDGFPECVNATSCDQVVCGEGLGCVISEEDGLPSCELDIDLTGDDCEQIEEGCNSINFLCEEDETGARCVQPSSCDELQPICKARDPNTRCLSDDGLFLCLPEASCDLVVCPPERPQCIEVEVFRNETFASCVDAPPFAGSCSEIDCPDTDVCITSSLPSENVQYATCTSREEAEQGLGVPQSCDTSTCPEEEQTCLELTLNGDLSGIFCTIIDCQDVVGGECPPGSECIPNSEVQITAIDADSFCIPPTSNFIGLSCEEREEGCPEFQSCQEVVMPDTRELVGSFCGGQPLSPEQLCAIVEPCEEEGEECAIIRTSPFRALPICQNRQEFLDIAALV